MNNVREYEFKELDEVKTKRKMTKRDKFMCYLGVMYYMAPESVSEDFYEYMWHYDHKNRRESVKEVLSVMEMLEIISEETETKWLTDWDNCEMDRFEDFRDECKYMAAKYSDDFTDGEKVKENILKIKEKEENRKGNKVTRMIDFINGR